MSKIYALIHDGNSLLFGAGGKSGAPPTPRPGLHLTGGTHDQATKRATILKEIREEMGFELDEYVAKDLATFQVKKIGDGVDFLVVKVPSVKDLAQTFKRPPVLKKWDEPFERVEVVAIDDAKDHPDLALPETSWFGLGVNQAIEDGKLT